MPDADPAQPGPPSFTIQTDSGWPAGACTLDHDGCVVCSDAGIPLRVVALQGDDALCEDAAGARTLVAVDLVQPVRVGEVLLTHGGVALGRVVVSGFGSEPRQGDHEVRQ
jgi:hypothetical protein